MQKDTEGFRKQDRIKGQFYSNINSFFPVKTLDSTYFSNVLAKVHQILENLFEAKIFSFNRIILFHKYTTYLKQRVCSE